MAEYPDLVVVFGDTDSTLAGALAVAKLHVPIAHVEAGLRSFNRTMPEEINRILTDHVSTLLLAPTETAINNLRREGIVQGVHCIGNIMHDSIRFAAPHIASSTVLCRLGIGARRYAIATIHRAENTNDRATLAELIEYVKAETRDTVVVFPIHPRTSRRIEEWGLNLDPILVCEPQSYFDMHRLIQSATVVFTDSGGLQNDAYFYRVPCVTLRGETEWVETVAAGWNRLWKGPDYLPRREISDDCGGAASRAATIIAEYIRCNDSTPYKRSY